MKTLRGYCRFCFALICLLATPAPAGTVAYWRFEEGPDGAQVSHGGQADGVFYSGVADSSGNANGLSVWAEGWAGFAYRSDRAFSTVPQTGAANNFSVQNTGGYPAMFTDSAAMRTMTPAAWTIEAVFQPELTDGYRTLVGRDSQGAFATDLALAALYFQIQPDESLAIKFCDVSGSWHQAISAPNLVQGFVPGNPAQGQWQGAAAVCDGSTLSLYYRNLEAGGTLQLVAQTDLTSSGSPNTALTAGLGSGSDWQAGNWSVGRGLWNGGHVDRAYGFMDEVRISDSALAPTRFVFEAYVDDVVPTVLSVIRQPNLTNIIVTFSEPMANNALTKDYYTVCTDPLQWDCVTMVGTSPDGSTFTFVPGSGDSQVLLATRMPFPEYPSYIIELSNMSDKNGNTIFGKIITDVTFTTGLFVDFTQTGGPVAAGYQGYFATQGQPPTFTPQSYTAFGSSITITPTWNGTLTAGQNPQMIDRGATQGNFLRDWIGTDCRGALFVNDPMTLTLSGVPAGPYRWLSYHHDPNDQTTPFDLTIHDASGSRTMTNIDISAGAELPRSTVNQVLWSDGSNPIRLVFDARTNFFLCNGFEMTDLDADDDGLIDSWEIEHFDNIAAQNGSGDPDSDGATNRQEQDAGTDPNDPDSDNDGLQDGAELLAGTNPADADSDDDGRTDGAEVNGPVTSNPLLADTDGDLINDGNEVANGSDPNDPSKIPFVTHLQVDFSLSPNGPLELFYQPYLALHEVNSLDSDPVGGQALGVDRLNQSYAAFGTTVHLSVSYPDLNRATYTEDQLKTVKQMLDRGSFLANYSGTKTNLMRGWIGTDARAISNGNGTNAPTTLRLAISGLPAGAYTLRSYHHDLQNQAGTFGIRITDADSTGALLSTHFRQTTSSGGNLANPGAGNGPETLRSTVTQVIHANGTDPVTVDFEKLEGAATELSFFALNGIEIQTTVDSDGDDMVDATETALFNDLSRDGTGDFDGDGLSDLVEILLNLDPKEADTDHDGLKDGKELNPYLTTPPTIKITGFTINRVSGTVSLDWFPPVTADFEVRTNITGTPISYLAGLTPPASFPIPPEFSGLPEAYLRVVGPSPGIGSNPFIGDTDGDGLKDGEEVNTYGSNPLDPDTDDDGFGDAREAADGSSPTDRASVPDQDGDGYSNARETAAGTNPNDPSSFPPPPVNALFVDFNSSQDDGGDSTTHPDPALSVANHNQKGYQSYHANHEVQAEFATASYAAFGTTVTLAPSWPDTTRNTVQQSIDRNDQTAAGVVVAGSNDANWQGDLINLLTDWLGIDTRTGEGGNGNYDGVTGTPTRLLLTLAGLPAGDYTWRSYHHDTENVHAGFLVEISTTGPAGSFSQVVGPGPMGRFSMTDSTPGGTPASAIVYNGYPTPGSSDPANLPSTVNTTFTATGTAPVVLRFTPLTDTGTHRQLWGINGFELLRVGP